MNKVFWDLVKYCVRKDPQTFYNSFLIRSTYSVVNFPKLQARHLVLKPLRSETGKKRGKSQSITFSCVQMHVLISNSR